DVAHGGRAGLCFGDQPVVAVAATAPAVAAAGQCATHTQCAFIAAPGRIRRQLRPGNVTPVNAVGRLLQSQGDGRVRGDPDRVTAELRLSVEFEGDHRPGATTPGNRDIEWLRVEGQAVGEVPDRGLGCGDRFVFGDVARPERVAGLAQLPAQFAG